MTQLYHVSQVISLTGICHIESQAFSLIYEEKKEKRAARYSKVSVGEAVVSKYGCNRISRMGEGEFMNQPLKNPSSNLNIGVCGGYSPEQ